MIRRDEPTKTGKDARIGTTTLDRGYVYDVTAHDMPDMSVMFRNLSRSQDIRRQKNTRDAYTKYER